MFIKKSKMRILYQKLLSPFSRKVRMVLDEKGLEYHTINKDSPYDRDEIFSLDPSGELPVLMEHEGNIIPYHHAICEYIDEMFERPSLMGRISETRAEVRRLCHWFDDKLYNDVVRYLLSEKVYKRLGNRSPNSKYIALARKNLDMHMEYISVLAEKYEFLAGDFLSMADICAVAQMSVLDYIGEVKWDNLRETKEWYMKIKSRKSFKSILSERVRGILPPAHYSNLDF